MTKQEALRDLRIHTATAIANVIVQNPFPVGLILALALNERAKAQARMIASTPTCGTCDGPQSACTCYAGC